jgi:hypothetical protein
MGSGGSAPNGSGGQTASGGSSGSGGVTATGGKSGSGGVAASGGSGSGGVSAGSGGTSSGGATASGGAATGGNSSGGTGGVAGSGGAPGSGGTGAGGCGAAVFCDDFESYTTGSAPGGNWKTQTNMGAVAVDGTQKHSGSKSVKFTTQSASGTKTAFMKLMGSPVFPAPMNTFYGRMMFYLQAGPTSSVHWTFVQAGGVVPDQTPSYHAVYRYGGQMPVMNGSTFQGSQLMASYDTPDSYSGTGPSSDCYQQSNAVVAPMGTWSCVEWKFDGMNNALQIWLDGKAIDELTIMGHSMGCVNQGANYTWLAPTFADLELGWESYQQDDARTLWIDDVAIGPDRLNCPSN